jgi:acetyl-CoA acetyltransferase family protein
MGLTAENVAEEYGVTREEQDAWAVISQNRAVQARESGHFDREIVPVTRPDGMQVAADDGPRPGTTMEKLATLQPAFKPDGTVTAGNACPLNDGAAAVLVMSAEKAAALGLKPRARIVASSVAAIRPEVMGIGPVPAIQQLLAATRMTIDDIDVVEINEAFAAQIVPCKDQLGIDDDKLNPFGGAIALGPPVRHDGRADHDHAAQRPRDPRRDLRDRVDVRGGRHGHGDARRAPQVGRVNRRGQTPLIHAGLGVAPTGATPSPRSAASKARMRPVSS